MIIDTKRVIWTKEETATGRSMVMDLTEVGSEFKRKIKWDLRFLKMAYLVASWSKDPSTKTGAVIVRPDLTVASVGFNGFPTRMQDKPEWLASENRETEKYPRMVHCEVNAVLHAKESVAGYTLYTVPFASCERCAVQMIQAGLDRFVFPEPSADLLSRWSDSLDRTKSYLNEANISWMEYTDEAIQKA